jgi:glutamate dehydrogenase
VDNKVQSTMLIDTSRQLERGTTWFLRSRRLPEDMAATIAHFTQRVVALSTRLPELLDAGDRARIAAAAADYVSQGVPEELASRVVTLDTLHSTLDIVEIAGATGRPVELVAEIYFELSTRLGLPWLRERISALPGDQHWKMLARGAMHDDLSGLQRTITGEVLTGGGSLTASTAIIASWQDRNRRAIERTQQLFSEFRTATSADAAMLSVALRELRNLS